MSMKISIVCGALLVVTATACKDKPKDGAAAGSATPKATEGGPKAAPSRKAEVGPRKVVKIGAGDGVACAVLDSGGVRCWGANDRGTRGTPAGRDDAATPVDVPGVTGAIDLVVGGDSGSSGDIACAWSKDARVTCWGAPAMLPGRGDAAAHEIPELAGARSIALGGGTGYAVKADGTVWGWGSAAFNALADGTTGGGSDKPLTAIPGVTGATQVAAGQNHGCALLGDGTVTCWGYSSKAQLPTAVAGVTGATALFAETQREETCALTAGGTLCWTGAAAPRPMPALAGVTKIVGRNHLCALDGGGEVLCWGDSADMGQLGRGGSASQPAPVEGLQGKAIDVAVGHAFACAALADGGAACWGYNQRGQLGDGTLLDRKVATPVTAITVERAVATRDGADAVQEGPDATAWTGLPAGCTNGPIAIAVKAYPGTTFAVKGARAKVQVGGKTIAIELADHNFHASWGQPRATQGKLGLRLAKVEVQGDKRVPVAVDLGEYRLGTDEVRLVSPTFTTKTGTSNLIDLSLTKGLDAGKVTLTHLDDAWVCGELALVAGSSTVKGPFAAPVAR